MGSLRWRSGAGYFYYKGFPGSQGELIQRSFSEWPFYFLLNHFAAQLIFRRRDSRCERYGLRHYKRSLLQRCGLRTLMKDAREGLIR